MQNNTPSIELIPAGEWQGGAWKVAYADFVTAMMAFFLLMWLLNVTDAEQRNAISSYFDPTIARPSQSQSGAGGVLGGLTAVSEGSLSSEANPIVPPSPQPTQGRKVSEVGKSKTEDGDKNNTKVTVTKDIEEQVKEKLREAEIQKFQSKADKLKEAIENSPELKELKDNLLIDITPEGLRIQVIDRNGKPMFPSGSAQMFQKTKALMTKIGELVNDLPNELSVRGHTDSVAYGPGATYTNWELSADRANSSRRVLKESGIADQRLNNVMGKAATEPLIEEDAADARNRRITILLLREELTNPDFAKEEIAQEVERVGTAPTTLSEEELNPEEEAPSTNPVPGRTQNQLPIGTFRKTPGNVQFP